MEQMQTQRNLDEEQKVSAYKFNPFDADVNVFVLIYFNSSLFQSISVEGCSRFNGKLGCIETDLLWVFLLAVAQEL